jgi:uncharacterized protein YndB with AHSA1/START domain
VGGRYRFVMHGRNGETHRVGGVYREIVPNRKLVYTWAWESTPDRESLVTVEFLPAGRGTELVLTHQRFFRHRSAATGISTAGSVPCSLRAPPRELKHFRLNS